MNSKKIWTAYYRNGLLSPTNVVGADETEAFSEAIGTARFHMGMIDKWKPEDIVERIEPADPADARAKWLSRPVVEFDCRGFHL